MTPTTRKELVALMAEAFRSAMGLPCIPWGDLSEGSRLAWSRAFEATITALEAAGCRVVPAEATEEMLNAAMHARLSTFADENTALYTAMLARSPFAKEGE